MVSKADVEDKIKKDVFQYRMEEVGTFVPGRAYVTRYKLDLEVQTVATEYRIYADENGKFHIPNELKGDVFYGENIKAIAAFLYSEGVVANDRICTFINSLSGDSLEISTGCIYNACNAFGEKCQKACQHIENNLLNADEICTDATPVKTDGKLSYVRNFSTAQNVLYCSSEKKDLETLSSFSILQNYTGILTHDHETALYHFGTEHVECNVHLVRYLLKNTEETWNQWSHDLTMFLEGLNHARNEQKEKYETCFSKIQLERYSNRYDQISL
ncbi:MAG: transposase [Anaerocolumna sp.]